MNQFSSSVPRRFNYKYPVSGNTNSLYAITVKLFFLTILLLLFIGCLHNEAGVKSVLLPKNSKLTLVKLVDSLGNIELAIPSRYDTFYQWTNWSDCGKPCAMVEYRFQPKNLELFMESGSFWSEPTKDTIERFTISHSAHFPFHKITEENYIQMIHERLRHSLQMAPSTQQIKFDTIQKINDRYFSIFVIDNIVGPAKEYSKKVISVTTVMGNGIEFKYELLTKSNDSICRHFIDNSYELLRTVKISNGI